MLAHLCSGAGVVRRGVKTPMARDKNCENGPGGLALDGCMVELSSSAIRVGSEEYC